jgi:hypothetical protein
MYKRDNELTYSPSDLNAFLENECVTWLDRFEVEHPGELKADEPEEEDELIRRTGDEHERSFPNVLGRQCFVALYSEIREKLCTVLRSPGVPVARCGRSGRDQPGML